MQRAIFRETTPDPRGHFSMSTDSVTLKLRVTLVSDPPFLWRGLDAERAPLFGERLLIVAPTDCLEETSIRHIGRGFDATLTSQYVDGTMKHQGFTDIARAALGGPVERPACEDFWRRVYFINLPRLSGGTRAHPSATQQDWDEARQALPLFFEALRPTAVLFLERRLEEQLEGAPGVAQALHTLRARAITAPHPGETNYQFRASIDAIAPLFPERGSATDPARAKPRKARSTAPPVPRANAKSSR